MIVLMPVATPTSSRGTDSTTRFAIDANEKPMPMPSSAPPTQICHSVAVEERRRR